MGRYSPMSGKSLQRTKTVAVGGHPFAVIVLIVRVLGYDLDLESV